MSKQLCLLRFFLVVILFNVIISDAVKAQDSSIINNEYFITYPGKYIVRVYLSRKFAPFTISSSGKEDLNYKTNSKLNLGAGFTYKILSLNFAYGFNFLNKDKGRGDTKGLDLQIHVYPHKWAVDLLGSFLRGYYLDPKAKNGLSLNDYYKRPDLHRNIVGLSVYRVANYNRFSYRAALTQNDWQTKSAGSLLYGAESYYGIVKADGSFVPFTVGSNYRQKGISKINTFTIGPGIGYAYTLVLSRHLFLTGSLIGSVNANFAKEENLAIKNSKFKILPGGLYKGAIGYNSASWAVSATLNGNALYASSSVSKKEYFLSTGSVNLFVSKKFGSKRSK